jgi:micrococcal nuclease
MKSFAKKFFWIIIFLLLFFCCWKIYSDFRNFSKTFVQNKISEKAIEQVGENISNQTIFSNSTFTAPEFLPVLRVIDGDTIVVLLNGNEETIRLLGMDTPETVDPRKSVQCFGLEASNETKSLLDGRSVSLQSDPTQSDRDKYGRLLRYVFRDDGLFIDEFLVKEGFAREYTYFDLAYKYQIAFRADQAAARQFGLGLWATSTCAGKI